MRKRQSSKRNVKNANSPRKEEPPDVIFQSREDVLEYAIKIIENKIKNDLGSVQKFSEVINMFQNEIKGIKDATEVKSKRLINIAEEETLSLHNALKVCYPEGIPHLMLLLFIRKMNYLQGLKQSISYIPELVPDEKYNTYLKARALFELREHKV